MIKKAIFLGLFSALPSLLYAKGGDCTFDIKGTDQMAYQYKGKDLDPAVPFGIPKKCIKEGVTFNLEHVGQLPRSAMGHNLIVSEAGNFDKIMAGSTAKPEFAKANYYDPSTENLMLAHTRLLGKLSDAEAKEAEAKSPKVDQLKDKVEVKAKAFDAKKDYVFFCTFPGHFSKMKIKIAFT